MLKKLDILVGIAQSSTSPIHVLEQLAAQIITSNITLANRPIAIKLIGNCNTPLAIRNQLLQLIKAYSQPDDYSNWEIYFALAFNSATSEQERNQYLQQLIQMNSEARRNLARHPETPPYILEELAETDAVSEVLENPNTPPDTLRKLVQRKELYKYKYLLENPSTPSDVVMKIFDEAISVAVSYRDLNDLQKLALTHPNVPLLERYKRALAISEEQKKARTDEFIVSCCKNIIPLRDYVARHGNVNARLMLCRMSNTPGNILEILSQDSDVNVRREVSKNPKLPLHCQIKLTKDPSIDVRITLASINWHEENKHTPVDILKLLAKDQEEKVREKVASNRNTPTDVLNELANDYSHIVKSKLASNPNTPPEVLESLWHKEKIFDYRNHNIPGNVLADVITHTNDSETLNKILQRSLKTYPQIPANTLENLSTHKSNVVRSHVAIHPNTPINVLEKFVDDSAVRWSVATNPNTPTNALGHLFRKWAITDGKYDEELCRRLAENRNSPPAILEHLAGSQNYQILKAVAYNSSTPISALAKIAREDSDKHYVLSALSHNPNINLEVIENFAINPHPNARLYAVKSTLVTYELWLKLACDQSTIVRKEIAAKSNSYTISGLRTMYGEDLYVEVIEHPHIPLNLWSQLAQDAASEVRQAVAGNVNTPASILELLVTDEVQQVRQKLGSNSSTPIKILETLALDIYPSVRQTVASNSNTPVHLIEELAQDEDKETLQALVENSNTPPNLRQKLQYILRQNISPTLRGLSRIYNPETDDLPTLLSEYVKSSTLLVKIVSLMHPLMSTEFLYQASFSLVWLERYAVAINPVTPIDIRERLAEDSNRIVKAAAKANLST